MTHDIRKIAMAASLGVAVLMLVGKLAAYFLTGSTAILSDAMESVIHILATGIAGFSLWYSLHPVSTSYPYGHGKIAYFSAGFEGALILVASLVIAYSAIAALVHGPKLEELGLGMAITFALAFVNLALGVSLVKIGKKSQSLILIANGYHVLSDMWTSFGVVVGVALTWGTDILWLDPLVALAVGLNILLSSVSLLQRAFYGLMDKANPDETESIIKCLKKMSDENLISGFHQLRHRRTNDEIFVEVHLLFPETLTITAAHHNANLVEVALRNLFPNNKILITSHLEPDNHITAHPNGHPHQDPFETAYFNKHRKI